jgi:hypothetical protein
MIVLGVVIVACGAPSGDTGAPEAPATVEIIDPELGLRLAIDPSRFAEVPGGDGVLALDAADGSDPGRVEVRVRPREYGQNIPAAVTEHRTAIEGRAGGTYLGAQELISPLGTTFTSRGRYTTDDGVVEETVVFALHPAGGRMLTVSYRYPAAEDSGARVEHLLEVVATIGAV